MSDGRKRLCGALSTLCITAVGASVLAATPSSAEPTIADVRERASTLYREAEQASERVNDARIRLEAARTRLDRLRDRVHEQRVAYHDARNQVVATVRAQVEGQTIVTASQVLLSEDPDAFIHQMTTVDEYTVHQTELTERLAEQATVLDARKRRAQRVVAAIAADRAGLVKDKAEIDSKAAAAVQFALAQVGDAYVYGAAGPDAYDCSGLTMAAWAQGGVSLPHSSSAQTGSGTPVSISALQPGDLVFYYSPISHVGMYIGNGMVVHAANPSVGVRTDPVGSMPISGAVRPG